MAFPTTGLLDNFNRADNADLGTAWTRFTSAYNTLQIITNRCAAGGGGVRGEYYNVTTYGPDSEVFATYVETADPSSCEMYFFVRMQAPNVANTNYDSYVVGFDTQATTGNGSIYRIDNGAFTLLGSAFDITIASGDRLGLEAIGTAIKAYRAVGAGAFAQVGSTQTDATYSTGNLALIVISDQTDDAVLDDFSGGTVVAVVGLPVGSAVLSAFGYRTIMIPME